MKKLILSFCFLVAVVFPSSGLCQTIMQLRSELRSQWFTDAQKVASQSGDTDSKAIVQFLKKNSVLGTPKGPGAEFLEESNTEQWFMFVPLAKGDEAISEQWRQYVKNGTFAANFMPDERAIITRETSLFSPTWRGILLLHEGMHAMTFLSNPYDWEDEREFCYKEVEAHNYTNRLLLAIGGQKYRALLEKEVARQLSKMKLGEIGNSVPVMASYYEPEFKGIFGLVSSELERNFRATMLWTHAFFTVLERNYKGDVENSKALVLRELYRAKGLLPER